MATSLAVRGIPLNMSLQEDVTLPLTGLGVSFSGSAVEYDTNEETIFYNDRSAGLIYKSNLNGTGEFQIKRYHTMNMCYLWAIVSIY